MWGILPESLCPSSGSNDHSYNISKENKFYLRIKGMLLYILLLRQNAY